MKCKTFGYNTVWFQITVGVFAAYNYQIGKSKKKKNGGNFLEILKVK